MATEEVIHAPHLGEHGEPCSVCGAPLAGDQRYCLNCGERRADARIPFMDILRSGGAATPPPKEPPAASAPAPQPSGGNRFGFNPLTLGVCVLSVVLLFGLGFLIGRSGQKTPKPVAQKAPVVNVTAGSSGGQTAQTTFTEDWPQGKDGYTVQLQVLPKSSTQPAAVNQAKTDATSKGATEVGALDSDQHSGMDPGNYVVYSGVFDTKKQAAAALKNLTANFPAATVVQVTASGSSSSASSASSEASSSGSHATNPKLKQLQKSSGKDYAKQSAKLPNKVETGGKPPPKDNKPAGGDTSNDATVIK